MLQRRDGSTAKLLHKDDHGGGGQHPAPTALIEKDPFFADFEELPPFHGRETVIRGAQFADSFSARQALERKRDEVHALDQTIKAAVEAGRAEGLADGRQKAAAEYASHLAELELKMREFYQSAEATIADLAISVAEQIIGSAETRSTAKLAARRAIVAHLDRQPYSLYVSPDAEDQLLEVITDLRVDYPGALLPIPKVDKRLPSGRAVMLTGKGSVEVDIESQIRAIRESLMRRQSGTAPLGDGTNFAPET